MIDPTKKINTSDLIKIAKDNKDKLFGKKISSKLDDVVKFIITFDIKSGKNKVKLGVMYKAYENWSLSPTTRIKFQNQLDEFFDKEGEFYLINYKPGELVNETERNKVGTNE